MPGLVLQARRRDDQGGASRVGFTASRKVGGAVVRNRAKRRLRVVAEQVEIHPGLVAAAFREPADEPARHGEIRRVVQVVVVESLLELTMLNPFRSSVTLDD